MEDSGVVNRSTGLDLTPLLAPRGVAVVGASERSSAGRQVLHNLLQSGFSGQVIPVNPRYEKVMGHRCWPSLTDAAADGAVIDLVAVAVGRDSVMPVMEEAASVGAGAAWVFASGFAEAGEEGKRLQEELTGLCLRERIALCGPNCVGLLRAGALAAYSAPFPSDLAPGNVGAVAQSGSVCLALANSGRGLGYSLLVSSGNEAVLDSTDYIAHMLEDSGVDVVLAFIEQFRRPDRLFRVAQRAAELDKPLVVLKVGRSDVAQRAALTHTGALAGSDAVHDAVFRKYGITRVEDVDELLETGVALSKLRGRWPRGPRAGVITLSGGEIGLIGDLASGTSLAFPPWSEATAERIGAHLPEYAGVGNPLDAWGSGRIDETYPGCMAAAAEDEAVDLVVVTLDMPPGLPDAQVAQFEVVARAAVDVSQHSERPVFVLSNVSGGFEPRLRDMLERGGIIVLQGTRAGLRAVHHAVAQRDRLRAQEARRPARPGRRGRELLQEASGALDEHTSRRFLEAYGVPGPPQRVCEDVDSAVRAAEELGYPVALKALSPDLSHKTEAGGVVLSIGSAQELRAAYKRMMASLKRWAPHAELEGVLMQKMVTGAVAETVVGVSRDPDFGPVVVFGTGGTLVELVGDRALALPPLSEQEAQEMVEGTLAGRLLGGFRGATRGDVRAVVDVLCSVGEMAAQWHDRIQGVDINPLLVLPEGQGVMAVDALVQLRDTEGAHG
ncbi:MAG: acetate--CoA ligase family protein [Candidatus Bipolaricaulota bacterium]